MKSSLIVVLTLVTGATITFGGLVTSADDILKSAKSAANSISFHNLALALEFYHLEHNSYPKVYGSEAVIDELSDGGYISGG